jgi:hypothetical protein
LSETDPSFIWDNLSLEQKQLAREYVKEALRAKMAKIALENSLGIDEIDDESTARLAEEFLIKEGNLQENVSFFKTVIEPLLKARVREQPFDLDRALCIAACILMGKSSQQCQSDCPE